MRKSHAKWIEFLYGPYFKVIGFFYRSYRANRARIEALKANARVAGFLKAITILILVGWILTWYFASEQSRTRLADEVRQSIGFDITPGDSTETPVQDQPGQ